MANRSLQYLVIIRIIAATLIFAAILACVTYVQLDKTLSILKNRTIADESRDIASYIEETKDNAPFLDLPGMERKFYAEANELHQYVVRDADGEILFTSPVAYTEQFPEGAPDERKKAFFEFKGEHGKRFLGSTYVHEHKDQQYIVQAAQSETSVETFPNRLLGDFLYRLALFGTPFIVLLIVVIYFSIRQSLKPIRQVSDQANAISFKRMDMRLSETGMPSEIQPLVNAVNNALSRLEQGVQAQREFTANAAHELRTPLSILRSHVDSLEDGETVRRLRQDIDTMTRLTNQLLDMARLDFSEAVPREAIRLDRVVGDVCRDLWPLFIDAGRELRTDGLETPSHINGNRDALYRAVRNLLENAMIHAPAKTPVEVTLADQEVIIRDYGATIEESKRVHIFERFQRGDHTVSASGSGLGLSIVKRTMEIHGGNARVEAREPGNAFILTFPEIS